jgi:hypothetical protein
MNNLAKPTRQVSGRPLLLSLVTDIQMMCSFAQEMPFTNSIDAAFDQHRDIFNEHNA